MLLQITFINGGQISKDMSLVKNALGRVKLRLAQDKFKLLWEPLADNFCISFLNTLRHLLRFSCLQIKLMLQRFRQIFARFIISKFKKKKHMHIAGKLSLWGHSITTLTKFYINFYPLSSSSGQTYTFYILSTLRHMTPSSLFLSTQLMLLLRRTPLIYTLTRFLC